MQKQIYLWILYDVWNLIAKQKVTVDPEVCQAAKSFSVWLPYVEADKPTLYGILW